MASILNRLPLGSPNGGGKNICLTMIVRNEGHCIKRCLSSVRHLVNSWAIIDTGSTDGTQEIICENMKDIPGALIERPWVDFSTNRNESLALGRVFKPDYFLCIDADEVAHGNLSSLHWPPMGSVLVDTGFGPPLPRAVLLRADLAWQFKGRIHELPKVNGSSLVPTAIESLTISTESEGGRHKVDGWVNNDMQIMVEELKDDPTDQRKIYLTARMLELHGLGHLAAPFLPHCKEYEAAIGFKRSA